MLWCSTTARMLEALPSTGNWPISLPWTRASRSTTPWATAAYRRGGKGLSGRLTAAMLEEVAPDANGRQVYACGPEGYLNTATELLQKVGVDDTSIYMEFFSGDRQTLLEYQAEVALAADVAEEIAEEIAESAEDYFESQPAAFGLYEPGYDADGTLQASGLPLEISDPEAPGSDPAVDSPGLAPEAGSPNASSFGTVGTGSLTHVLHAYRHQCPDRSHRAHPRGGPACGCQDWRELQGRYVRLLQGRQAFRGDRDEPPGRDPGAGNLCGQVPALLLHGADGPGYRCLAPGPFHCQGPAGFPEIGLKTSELA